MSIINDPVYSTEQTISLSVDGTASASDYTLPDTLTLPPGGTSVTAMLSASDDTHEEQDETVVITASLHGQDIGTATVTIQANDVAAWSVSADRVEIEEGENATITLAITNGKTYDDDQTISLETAGTASASDDYSLPATATLLAGRPSVTVMVSATDDSAVEEDETVVITAHAGTPTSR